MMQLGYSRSFLDRMLVSQTLPTAGSSSFQSSISSFHSYNAGLLEPPRKSYALSMGTESSPWMCHDINKA